MSQKRLSKDNMTIARLIIWITHQATNHKTSPLSIVVAEFQA